jgi:diguanylate cyclase (GGDEF)-like protein/PAS domain S-box-containing protein
MLRAAIASMAAEITDLKHAQDALQANAATYRNLVETAGELIWSLDVEGRWTYLNAAATRLYGKQPGELIGRPFGELVARGLQERDEAVFRRVFAGEPVFDHETRHLRADGSYVDLSFNAAAWRDPQGNIIGASGTARDVTQRTRGSAALHETIEKLRLAIELADLNYWEWDAASDSLKWAANPEGASVRTMKWSEYAAVVSVEDRERYVATAREAMTSGEPLDVEYRIIALDGSVLWVSARGVPMLDADGKVQRIVGVARDITGQKRREEGVSFLAYHDSLTGLPNRRLLQDRLNQALFSARRRDGKVGAMLIDLDDFKQVNDSGGHRIGDTVLREAAQRLGSCVRKSDTVARHGGDEFVILVADFKTEIDCQVVAEKVLRALGQPFEAEGSSYRLGASIGIAVFPATGADGDALLRNADAAMYHAKQLGGNQYRFHG